MTGLVQIFPVSCLGCKLSLYHPLAVPLYSIMLFTMFYYIRVISILLQELEGRSD